jgi:hypothetical protein
MRAFTAANRCERILYNDGFEQDTDKMSLSFFYSFSE